MKKFIINIAVFFFLILGIDICVGYWGDFLQTHSKGNETKRIYDLIAKDYHDVIILGSSRAKHHYDTPYISDSLNIDAYNAGYDGYGVLMGSTLLELILERYQPQLVIYDVTCGFDIYENPDDNHDTRYIKWLKPYFRHSSVERLIMDVSQEEWYKVHSGLIRYNSTLFTLGLDYLGERKYLERGYEPKGGVLEDTLPGCADTSKEDAKFKEIDPLKIKYVKHLIALAKDNNVPIVFVKSPRYGVKDSFVLKPIKEICLEYDVPFYDYRCSNNFQRPMYFYDRSHLNYVGAREFSLVIADDIITPIIGLQQRTSRQDD